MALPLPRVTTALFWCRLMAVPELHQGLRNQISFWDQTGELETGDLGESFFFKNFIF